MSIRKDHRRALRYLYISVPTGIYSIGFTSSSAIRCWDPASGTVRERLVESVSLTLILFDLPWVRSRFTSFH